MLLQNIRAKIGARLSGKSEEGFTLIELLVVMLILGILAAIALPAFFNQKSKASDAKAKESAHSAQVAMETCATENPSGSYAGCTTTVLKSIEQTLPSNGTAAVGTETFSVTLTANQPRQYAITVNSTSGATFGISRSSEGALTYPCTPVSASNRGGCPSTNVWN